MPKDKEDRFLELCNVVSSLQEQIMRYKEEIDAYSKQRCFVSPTPRWEPPLFSGKEGEHFHEFESELIHYHIAYQWTSELKARHLGMMLKYKARQVYEKFTDAEKEDFDD